MKVCVIYNPVSGKPGKRASALEAVKNCLSTEPSISYRLVESKYAGHATILAKESADAGDQICFAAGGDGTMNEVARGLIGSQTSLGIIPLGSGNGLARHFKIPLAPAQAVRSLLYGQTISMDSGMINDIPFFLAAGIGFEGAVAGRFASKKSRGFISYLQSATEEFFRWKPIRYKAKYEQEVLEGEAFTIDFANGSQYGNNAIISPGASTDDGLLQFVRVLPFPLTAAPEMFFQLLSGKINRSAYHIERAFSSLELSVEGAHAVSGHADGEAHTFSLPIRVRVLPASLLVRIP